MWTAARRSRTAFLVLALLLLKAAMPLLASQAAHSRGVPLVEVCTVYGVATVPAQDVDAGTETGGAHPGGDQHCALATFGAWMVSPAGDGTGAGLQRAAADEPVAAVRPCGPPDPCARWMVRLKHAPPRLS